jgi:hypothetical protein
VCQTAGFRLQQNSACKFRGLHVDNVRGPPQFQAAAESFIALLKKRAVAP